MKRIVIFIFLLTISSSLVNMAQESSNDNDSPSAESTLGSAWRLIWQDEFEGDSIDTAKWNTTLGELPGAAGERYHNTSYAQYIMDDDVIVEDGLLRLRAQNRTIIGDDPAGRYEYTAGWISTDRKFDFKYGFVEIRGKFPVGQGMWPAFWMVAADHIWGPEFDIAEYFGNQQRMHLGLMYSEWPDVNWDSQNYRGSSWADNWHIYALEWNRGEVHFLVDGQIYHTIFADYVPDEPMFIILQNGVSSATGPGGSPDNQTVFPNYFDVDYVRVYQRESDAKISNRGFETGTDDGWILSPNASVLRRDFRSGRFALRLLGENARAEQVIRDLKPNTIYQVTAWGKVGAVEDKLTIGISNHNGATQEQSISATNYTQVTLTFTTDSTDTEATLFCLKDAGNEDAFCDDFELIQISD